MGRVRRLLQLVLLVLVANAFAVNSATAQPVPPVPACPVFQGCTVYIMMNGIMGEGAAKWSDEVIAYGNAYRAAHTPALDPVYVKFESVYNHGGFWPGDMVQSINQWLAQEEFKRFNIYDPDLQVLLSMIDAYSSMFYRVVLVGHSQSTFYMNFVYESIRDKKVNMPAIWSLPDPNKLVVVNIASAADHVADGNGRYTTVCGDIILIVPGSLSSNITNSATAGCNPLPLSIGDRVDLHNLLDTYLKFGSKTRQQIYADLDLAAGRPEDCGANTNCYLWPTFWGSYIADLVQVGNTVASQNSTIDATSWPGMLQLNSLPYWTAVAGGPGPTYPILVPGQLTLSTRRVFAGDFTVTLEYNSYGEGYNIIGLDNVLKKDVYPRWELGGDDPNDTWHTLKLSRKGTKVDVYADGLKSGGGFVISDTASYRLRFDLQGNNTLNIRNLLVVRGAEDPPPPPPVPTASCSANPAIITAGQSTVFTGTSSGGTGTLTGQWNGRMSGNGPSLTYKSLPSAPAEFVNETYTVTDSGNPPQKTNAYCSVQVNALPPDFNLTPAASPYSIVQEGSVTHNMTLASQGGLTGTATLGIVCLGTCPTGFTYKYSSGTRTLPATGSVPLFVTFTSSASSLAGTYNFRFDVTLGGIKKSSTIALTVTAPPKMVFTPDTAQLSVQRGNSNYVNLALSSQNGMAGTVVLSLSNMQPTAPVGITYDYPTSTVLPANGGVNARVTFYTTAATPAGIYNYEYRATLNGQTVVSKIALTVPLPVVTLTPGVSSLTVVRGNSGYKDITLNSLNGMTGTATWAFNCVIGCSPDIAYDYTRSSVLPANGNVTARVTFYPSAITSIGTYNFEYKATLNGQTVTAQIALVVTPPPFSISCSFSPSPVTLGNSVKGTISQSGGVLPINYTQNGANLGTSNTFTYTTDSVTTLTANVTAKDAAGRTASNSCSVSVVPAPTMTISPSSTSFSIKRGNSAYLDLTLASQGGMKGTATMSLNCPSGCPTVGTISYTYPTSLALPANGSANARVFFNTTTSTPLGAFNFEYQAKLNGQTVVAKMKITFVK